MLRGILGLLVGTGCLIYSRIPETRTCNDLGPRRDGESCVCDTECKSGLCFTEVITGIPQGECRRECETSDECTDSTVCDVGSCRPPCDSNRDCEPTRVCAKIGEVDACFPLCSSGEDCESGICDPWTIRCRGPGDPEPFGGGVAEACTDGNECKSGLCSDGGCLSLCSVQRQGCPDDADCVRLGGDLGECLLRCEVDDDCRRFGWGTCAAFTNGESYCYAF